MDVITAIQERRAVRAFLEKPVPKEMVETILKTAQWAPSGKNTQPWRVLALGQKTIQALGQAISADIACGNPSSPEDLYYPSEWFEPYITRGKTCGLALYNALGIQKENIEQRKIQWLKNYYFFGAPWGFLFLIDRRLEKGSWLDMGLFIENTMLAARGLGLETCPLASLAERPAPIRKICHIHPDWHIVCGMALGYADWNHPANQYRTTREPLDFFVEWQP